MISIFLDGAKEQPGFHVDMFLSFTRERHLAIDKALHDRLIAEGEACIDRNDSGGLRRVIGQILDNQYPTSANAAADGCRPLALKIAVRQRRKRGKTMRAGVGTNLQSDRSLGPALICSASVPSRIRLSI